MGHVVLRLLAWLSQGIDFDTHRDQLCALSPRSVAAARVGLCVCQYTVIERDVKQAVRLLEMSLSGLMSAESALKRWKGEIPTKVCNAILCVVSWYLCCSCCADLIITVVESSRGLHGLFASSLL